MTTPTSQRGAIPDLIQYADVQWAFVSPRLSQIIPAYTYTEPTITASANGVLSIDGGSPILADRVVFSDNYHGPGPFGGIYTVTDVGSTSTPWVLTRAAATPGVLRAVDDQSTRWTVNIIQGTDFAGGSCWGYGVQPGFILGASYICTQPAAADSAATGNYSTASGPGSTASGLYSTASGDNSIASSVYSVASGDNSVASGLYSVASGNSSVASGNSSVASGLGSIASGLGSIAYADYQVADSGLDSYGGEHSLTSLGTQTDDATATQLLNNANTSLAFQDTTVPTPVARYNKTVQFTARITARRTDVPGTDSAWTITGVVRGNGTSAYSFIGGVPAAVLVAQDTAASTWTVAVSMSANEFVLTVTGQAAKEITWGCVLDWCEVYG